MQRIATLGLALALGGAAQADFIQVQAEGTFELVQVNQDQVDITFDAAVFAQVGGFGITAATGEASQLFTGDPTDDLLGTGELVGATQDDVLNISFEGVVFPGDASATFAGTWEVTGATGAYDGLTGGGEMSGFYRFVDADSGQFGVVFQGDLVPAPATLALLGAAGLGLARRRR